MGVIWKEPGRGEVEGDLGKKFHRNSYRVERIGDLKMTSYWKSAMRLTSPASDMERLGYVCLLHMAGCDWGRSGSRRGGRFWPPGLSCAVSGGRGCNGSPTGGRKSPSLT